MNIDIAARGKTGFTDIPAGAWYEDHAAWTLEKGYAYWLTGGIDESADAETIENVIKLFCLENG